MTAKNLLSAALLLFVAASVIVLIGREVREPSEQLASTEVALEALPDDGFVVYYFHGDTRCPTCRKMEDYTDQAVHAAFKNQLANRTLRWQVVNYEQPENQHFASEYEIYSASVILVRRVNGVTADWRNLDRVWVLVGDQEAFMDYIEQETRAMLNS